MPCTRTALAVAGALLAGGAANAEPGAEELKLHDSSPTANAEFGSSVAADGTMLVVGSPLGSGSVRGSGSAAVFDVVSGREVISLEASDGVAGDAFGAAVAMQGSIAVIGAPGADDQGAGSGAAYLFDLGSGKQLAKLVPTNGSIGDAFGSSVAIDGGIVAIGARYRDGIAPNAGAVYLFDLGSLEQIAMIEPASLSANDSFGCAVAMGDGRLVAGAQGTWDGPLYFAGAAYVLEVSSGEVQHVLRADDAAANDFFGAAVAIDGDRVVVGAWSKSLVFDHSGAAYVFDAVTGIQQGPRLSPRDAADRDHFGRSVAIRGDLIAIGSPGDDDAGFESGSVHLYDATSSEPILEIHATDASPLARLGASVSLASDRVVAGAPGDDQGAEGAGAVYVFDLGGAACAADLDDSGSVDGVDLSIMLGSWGAAPRPITADLNQDGAVDAADLAWLLAAWGVCG